MISAAHFKERGRAVGFSALVAVGVALGRGAPPARTVDGLRAMLSRAVHGSVGPGEVFWEPGRGVLVEALLGRRVLFLASKTPGGDRDLYRARVRLSAEGQPIEALGLRDVTETPLGDDAGLEVRGANAVFATTAFGRVQGVTALDLEGVALEDRPGSLADKALLALASFRRFGSVHGLGRTDIVFDVPARSAKIVLVPPHLLIDVEEPSEAITLDLATADVRGTPGHDVRGLRVVRQDYRGRSTLAWAVDLVRDAVGATPMAWFEDSVFGAKDLAKRAFSKLFRWSRDSRLRKGNPEPAVRILKPADGQNDDTSWPPPPIASLWEEAKPGEGKWEAVTYPWLPKLDGDAGKSAPPYFYTTFIRPDPDRPYTEVLLVAMDMRQLELGMEGGYEEPEPVVGPAGTGRVPRSPAVLPRVVAAFNGAFKAEHGAYGMMVGHRMLLPPVPGAATVVVRSDGAAAFGNWPSSKDVPGDVASFRQNLDPLVDGGVANPLGRKIWGWQVAGESSLTERTAICLTLSRHVIYAWGRDISGPGLSKALVKAGCDYAMHLDMNPRHCGFVFMRAPSADGHDGNYRLADSGMSINPSRYYLGSDKDFFYVMVRDAAPPSASGLAWTPSPGAEPPPSWLPAVHEATLPLGELEIRLVRFDEGRVDWVVRAGAEEPGVAGGRSKKIGLEPDLEGRVIAAIGLGHTTDALRYGLVFDGQPSLDLRQSYATVVLAAGRAPRIAPPGSRPSLAPGEDAVQLPLLAEDAVIDPRATDRGGTRDRGALCVLPDGRVLVALARHDSSDPLASTLIDEGCRRVVALDRGSRHAAFVHRALGSEPPRNRYDESVLYALGRPMTPRASRWLPDGESGAAPVKQPLPASP